MAQTLGAAPILRASVPCVPQWSPAPRARGHARRGAPPATAVRGPCSGARRGSSICSADSGAACVGHVGRTPAARRAGDVLAHLLGAPSCGGGTRLPPCTGASPTGQPVQRSGRRLVGKQCAVAQVQCSRVPMGRPAREATPSHPPTRLGLRQSGAEVFARGYLTGPAWRLQSIVSSLRILVGAPCIRPQVRGRWI